MRRTYLDDPYGFGTGVFPESSGSAHPSTFPSEESRARSASGTTSPQPDSKKGLPKAPRAISLDPPGETADTYVLKRRVLALSEHESSKAVDAFEALDSYALWSKAPGVIGPRAAATMSGVTGAIGLEYFGASGESVLGDSGSLSYGMSGMRGGAGAFMGVTDPSGRYLGSSAYFTPGGSGSISLAMADRTQWGLPYRMGLSLGTNKKLSAAKIGFFGGVGVGPITVAGGLGVSLSGNRVVKYVKPYMGKDPKLKGKHLIRATRTFGKSASLTGGAAFFAVGAGGRLAISKNQSVETELYVSNDELKCIKEEAKGFEGVLKKHCGLYRAYTDDDSIAAYELSEPRKLPVGYTVRSSTTGTMTGGVVVQAGPVRTGYVATISGDFLMAVRKIDKHHVELYTCPTKLSGKGVYVDLPMVGKISWDKIDEIAGEQAFLFDLRQDTAVQAYRRALNGELPCHLKFSKGVDEESLLAAWANEKLPIGVTRTALSKAKIKMTRKGWAVGFFYKTASAYTTKTDGLHMIADGKHVLTRDEMGKSRDKTSAKSGEEDLSISAAIHKVTTRHVQESSRRVKYASEVHGVILQIKFHDTKAFGSDVNDKVVAPLNATFNLGIEPYRREGHGQEREVFGEMLITLADMDRLAKMAGDVRGICEITRADHRALGDLVYALGPYGAAHSERERAEAVQTYVAEHGLEAMNVLYRMLKKPLLLRAHCQSYVDAVEEATGLALKWHKPIRRVGKGSKRYIKELNTRFVEVYDAIDQVRLAYRDLHDDAIMKRFDPTLFDLHQRSLFFALGELLRCVGLAHLKPHQATQVLTHVQRLRTHQKVSVLRASYPEDLCDDADFEDIICRFMDVEGLRAEVLVEKAALQAELKKAGTNEDCSLQIKRLDNALIQLDELLVLARMSTKQLEALKAHLVEKEARRERDFFLRIFTSKNPIHFEMIGRIKALLSQRRRGVCFEGMTRTYTTGGVFARRRKTGPKMLEVPVWKLPASRLAAPRAYVGAPHLVRRTVKPHAD